MKCFEEPFVEIVRIRRFSGLYFPPFGPEKMRVYFLRSCCNFYSLQFLIKTNETISFCISTTLIVTAVKKTRLFLRQTLITQGFSSHIMLIMHIKST